MKTSSMIGLALLVTACAADSPVSPLSDMGPYWAVVGPEGGRITGTLTGIGGRGVVDVEVIVELTLQAARLPNGSTVGFAQFSRERALEVIPVVPASERLADGSFGRDFWCIALSGDVLNIYIRDTGDGITAFDQIAFSRGQDCARELDLGSGFETLLRGDYKVRPPTVRDEGER